VGRGSGRGAVPENASKTRHSVAHHASNEAHHARHDSGS
jgi:hypothetical protein